MAVQGVNKGFVVSSRFLALLYMGIVLVFIGIAIIVVASVVFGSSGNVSGVILIGPIPIVFGSGSDSGWLIAISVVLTIISLVLFLVINRKAKRI